MEFMYLVFPHMPGERYRGRLRSLLLLRMCSVYVLYIYSHANEMRNISLSVLGRNSSKHWTEKQHRSTKKDNSLLISFFIVFNCLTVV